MRATIAEELYAVIRSVDPGPATEITDHLLARTGGRLLEEAVEAAIDCGLSASDVQKHVADAIYNECRKRNCFPSELAGARGDHAALTGELSDTGMLVEYLRYIAGITPAEMEAAAEAKLEKLQAKAKDGTLSVVDGLMYTTKAPGA